VGPPFLSPCRQGEALVVPENICLSLTMVKIRKLPLNYGLPAGEKEILFNRGDFYNYFRNF
jgi:hypothetical protein